MNKYPASALNNMKLKELRKYAQSCGVKTTGKPKWVIVDELTEHKYQWIDSPKKKSQAIQDFNVFEIFRETK